MPRILFTYKVYVRSSPEIPWEPLRKTPWTNKKVALKDAAAWLTPQAPGASAKVLQQELRVFELRMGKRWVELVYVLIPNADMFDKRKYPRAKKDAKSKEFLEFRKLNPRPRNGRKKYWDA